LTRTRRFSRLTKASFILGITVIVISAIQGSRLISGNLIEYGSYEGVVLASDGSIFIEAWGRDDRPFSLYVIDLDNVTLLFEEGSMYNATAIFSIENVQYFSSTVNVHKSGWFGIVVTPANSSYENMRYDLIVGRGVPHFPSLTIGILLLVVCLVSFIYSNRVRI
jgi:hypothetical protein